MPDKSQHCIDFGSHFSAEGGRAVFRFGSILHKIRQPN